MLREGLVHFTKQMGIISKENYVDILKQHLKTSVRKLKLGHKWVFQMAKVVAKCLKGNKVKVLEWLLPC